MASLDRCAAEGFPATNGPADYALVLDSRVVAAVEAKKVRSFPLSLERLAPFGLLRFDLGVQFAESRIAVSSLWCAKRWAFERCRFLRPLREHFAFSSHRPPWPPGAITTSYPIPQTGRSAPN